MALSPALVRSYRFHKEHGGYVVGHRAECALRAARAELEAASRGWYVTWEYDDYADLEEHEYWCNDARRERAGYTADGEPMRRARWHDHGHEHETLWAALRDQDGNCLESMSGVIDPSYEYRRVVAADMAMSALA